MSLAELRRIFEKRRFNLIKVLENPEGISPEKQHQIYGAILEIENFLKTIDYLREKELRDKNQ